MSMGDFTRDADDRVSRALDSLQNRNNELATENRKLKAQAERDLRSNEELIKSKHRVEDQVERLNNRVGELLMDKLALVMQIKTTVAAYDAYTEREELDLEELSEQIEALRGLVAE